MKLSINSFLILCSAFLYTACVNPAVNVAERTEDDLYKLTIRPPDMDTLQDLYLSEIADSVYYVALSDEPMLGSIYNFEKTNNSIVLKDQDGPLRLYDLDGNFKRSIGDIGRGPGEYLYPTWTVNKKTDTVYLSGSSIPQSISLYSLSDDSDGKMIGRIKNDITKKITNRAGSYYSLGNNILARGTVSSNTPLELALFNPQKNIIIDSLPNYHNAGNRQFTSVPYSVGNYKDELYYNSPYSDTLYRVTDKKITPFIVFDFGKYKLPIKITTSDIPPLEVFPIINSSIMLHNILRTSNALYLKFGYGEDLRFTCVLNLDDGTVRYCKPYFINDLDNGPKGGFSEWQIIDVAPLKAREDGGKNLKWSSSKTTPKLKDADVFQRLVDKSTEESNHIIQFFKFKD